MRTRQFKNNFSQNFKIFQMQQIFKIKLNVEKKSLETEYVVKVRFNRLIQ